MTDNYGHDDTTVRLYTLPQLKALHTDTRLTFHVGALTVFCRKTYSHKWECTSVDTGSGLRLNTEIYDAEKVVQLSHRAKSEHDLKEATRRIHS